MQVSEKKKGNPRKKSSSSLCGADVFLVICRYVYNYLGGKHDNVLEELVATVCTYGIAIVWLGPREAVLAWAFFNCFGLNFELWTAKFFSMEPFASFEVCQRCLRFSFHDVSGVLMIFILQAAMSEATSRRIRAIFNTFNFWCIILYNVLFLTSLDFAKLVAKRLLLKGTHFLCLPRNTL